MIKYRTNEWHKARIGKFTASCFADLMARPADKNAYWSKTAFKCIEEASRQLYFNQYNESPDSDATRWGIKNEDKAIQEFSIHTGFKVKETGFLLHPTIEAVGATPDTLVIEEEDSTSVILAQIKCPYNPSNHQDYLKKIYDGQSLKKSKSAYFWQIQGEIWVTNAKHSYFVSFDPRLESNKKLHIVKIKRDQEAIDSLQDKVLEAILLRDEILEEFQSGKRTPCPFEDFRVAQLRKAFDRV